MNLLKIGIIGFGFMGKTHASNIKNIRETQITAIYSAVEEKILPEGSKFFSDWKSLIDMGDIDAVVIATPTNTHAEIACYAAAKRKHIFLEKPMARTVDQCNQILDACKKNNVKLCIGHVVRSWPSYASAFNATRSKDTSIGELKMIRARRFSTYPSWAKWFEDEQLSGGCILDLSIHDIDFAVWLFGANPVEIFCEARKINELGINNWGISFTTIKFEGNKIAHCEAAWAGAKNFPFSTDCEIIGTEGIIRFDSRSPIPVRTYSDSGLEISDLYLTDGYFVELNNFIQNIKNNTVPFVSGEDGKKAVALCIAALKSANEKRPVLMKEVWS